MKINTELIQQTFDTLKSNLLEICTVDELTIDTLESKIIRISACIDVLDTLSIFIDDKDFINEFTAYNLVGHRLIDNSLDVFENKDLRSSLIDSLCNMGVNLDSNPINNLVEDNSISNKILVENIELNKESKLNEIKKEMTSKEKVNLMVEETNYKIMTYFREPNDMKEYLNYMAKFHNYSPRNLALIEEQFSGAKAVGSFKFWKDNGFKINKGEKGIKILVPTKTTYLILGEDEIKQLKYATKEEKEKVKNGQIKTIEKTYYKTGYVFDISQTNAKASDLPKLFPNKWIEGELKDYDKLYNAMNKIAENMGTKIIEPKEELGVSKGFFYPRTNEVALNPRNSQLQNVKTLLHELAHAKLHTLKTRNNYSKQEKEYQAEMVSYTTCSYFGIDTSDYSLDYMYNWTRNMDFDECINIIEEVKETSQEFIKTIENTLTNDLKIENTNDEIIKNDKINNTIYTKFVWSENKHIEDESVYTFETANEILETLTDIHKAKGINGYDKTKFELYSDKECTNKFYTGKFDIGGDYADNLKKNIFKTVTELEECSNISTKQKQILFNILGIDLNKTIQSKNKNIGIDI